MHKELLLLALQQARLGQGSCAPNPSVGAVAVQNGNIIAQAYHQAAGQPHAEQLLLSQFAPNTPGVSIYITLEPCNHWGKTPPCVEAIVQHGIEEVFFAYLDPNPIVAKNDSSTQLRAQGIKVHHLPLSEIDAFYQSYHHWTLTHRPRVTVKMAQSLDGKIGSAKGDRLILSNELCDQFTHQMRAASDVLLSSAHTILRDNPLLNVRLGNTEQPKSVALIDRQLSLDPTALVFSKAQHCHVYHHSNKTVSYPNATLYPTPLNKGLLDLQAIFAHLGALGFHDVWAEVGGTLFTALHQQNLVDQTYLYLVPAVLGEEAVCAYQKKDLFSRPHTVSWRALGDNMLACFNWKELESVDSK